MDTIQERAERLLKQLGYGKEPSKPYEIMREKVATELQAARDAERERCSLMAETWISPDYENAFLIGAEIAAAIREGAE